VKSSKLTTLAPASASGLYYVKSLGDRFNGVFDLPKSHEAQDDSILWVLSEERHSVNCTLVYQNEYLCINW
jgi:hypothetical protein